MELLQTPEHNVLKQRKMTVEEQFDALDMPPNVQWIPSKRDLIRLVLAQDKLKETEQVPVLEEEEEKQQMQG